jgi:hypothetical protein
MKSILIAAAVGMALAAPVFAKLPAPAPMNDEQKLKAEEAKQRTAWQGKVAAYQQCQAEGAVVDKYVKSQRAKGKDLKLDPGTCVNPGPFTMAAAAPAAPAAPAPAKK